MCCCYEKQRLSTHKKPLLIHTGSHALGNTNPCDPQLAIARRELVTNRAACANRFQMYPKRINSHYCTSKGNQRKNIRQKVLLT